MAIKVDSTKNIPTQTSTPEQWIEWHKSLKSDFGKKQANSLFVKAWKMRGSNRVNTSDLRSYLEKNGVKIDKSAWDSVVDTGVGVTDFFGDVFTAGKYISIGLAAMLALGIGVLVFNIAKKPVEVLGAAAKLKGGVK